MATSSFNTGTIIAVVEGNVTSLSERNSSYTILDQTNSENLRCPFATVPSGFNNS